MENTETSAGAETTEPPARDYPLIDAICLEVKNVLRCFEPAPEVSQHFRNARIEVLKGVRTMIDRRIEHLSRGAGDTGRKIAVE